MLHLPTSFGEVDELLEVKSQESAVMNLAKL